MDTNSYILIVDDNPMNLMLTSHVLENEGYHTRTAEDGISGLAAISTEIPILILLDVMMPEMNGYEVCRRIKENEKWIDIPVIFLTANIQTENIVEGFHAGGVDYITKPFKSEELLVRVKNHLELADSRRKILEMIKSRDKLYSIIAHDIRSPLSGILQTIDAIDQGYFDTSGDDFRELIHHLKIRTKETSTLLTSLLQWTRLQSGHVEMQITDGDLKPVISSCVRLLEANAEEKNILIRDKTQQTLLCKFDEVSVHTILRNILSNAIKFTPANGQIVITAETDRDNQLRVNIKDSGIGMSEEVVKMIFENDKHYSSSGTANEQGTGLGLMLVKEFIRRNHGKLEISSAVNAGTTISVTFPC